MNNWKQIARHIEESTGTPFVARGKKAIGGGCINRCYRLCDGARRYFVKINRQSLSGMFTAELAGLAAITATATIRAPIPICSGISGQHAYLVLEFISMQGSGAGGQGPAGMQLAAMHRHLGSAFGFASANFIGATPQRNEWTDDWCTFWQRERLGYQLRLAADNGHRGQLQQRGEQLLERTPALLEHEPQPSLIHGDLWGGNLSYDPQGNPVIYDPATYYGDREAEIAMTELFGGFGRDFYQAYQDAWPLDSGYAIRKRLYNLYHILNHLNLFGGGYASQALSTIDGLLAELGH